MSEKKQRIELEKKMLRSKYFNIDEIKFYYETFGKKLKTLELLIEMKYKVKFLHEIQYVV